MAAAEGPGAKRQAGRPGGPTVAPLLAAGESTRMGRPKQLLEWEGRPLIVYQVRELLAAGVDEVIAVLGHRAEEVGPLAEQAGARTVFNAAYREGRAGSIRTGAIAILDSADPIVILNVDQPRHRGITRVLLEAHREHGNLISVPVCDGRRGHPAVVAGALLDELRAVSEASEGLRALMRRYAGERIEVPIDDPAVLLDLNLPSDYLTARESTL